jgi:hypothetical protein
VLTWADVGIALVLKRLYGAGAATLFFLSPVSIIITGYHNQFDNIAVLLMLLASYSYERLEGRHRDIAFLVFFSLSLIMKHIFAFYFFWIIFSERLSKRQKVLYVLVPLAAFVLSFVFYCGVDAAAWHGVITNVVSYRSENNAPLLGPFFHVIGIPERFYVVVFVAIIAFFGRVFRKSSSVESVLNYTMCMVAFSSAIANQYLAIPLAALSVLSWKLSLAYDATGLVFLMGNGNGLHMGSIQRLLSSTSTNVVLWYATECWILFAAIVLVIIRMRGKNLSQSSNDADLHEGEGSGLVDNGRGDHDMTTSHLPVRK